MPKLAPERLSIGLLAIRLALYPIGTVMKVVRYFARLTRKRERQLRPLTVSDFFLKRLVAIPAQFFRWGPAKKFARRYIVPRVLPQMSDLRYGLARWRMSACADDRRRTCLEFKAELEPDFWVPPLIGPWLIQRKLHQEAIVTAEGIEKLAHARAH